MEKQRALLNVKWDDVGIDSCFVSFAHDASIRETPSRVSLSHTPFPEQGLKVPGDVIYSRNWASSLSPHTSKSTF